MILLGAGVAAFLVLGGDDSPADQTPESVPAGAVAVVGDVEDGVVEQEEFDASLRRLSEQQGLREPPTPADATYENLRDQAMGAALTPIWIRGEAAERGVTATEGELADRGEQVRDQNFGSEKEFEQFAADQGFCTESELAAGTEPLECEGVQREVEVMVLAEKLQQVVLGDASAETADEQTEIATAFEEEFTARWRERTLCAEEYVYDRCANGPEPDPAEVAAPAPGTDPAAPPGDIGGSGGNDG